MNDPDALPRLRAAVATAGPGAFAVLDGARFDDFAQVRRDVRLVAHPLLLDHAHVMPPMYAGGSTGMMKRPRKPTPHGLTATQVTIPDGLVDQTLRRCR